MNNFDFLLGTWDVVNRRLEKRLAGSDEWETFPATSECMRLLEGAANLDQMAMPTRGTTGMTLRLFDQARDEWSLYWMSTQKFGIEPPVIGRFTDGVGVFFGDDYFDGKPIRVRYTWSEITAESARWDQAFSADGGATWETNWIMDFKRRQISTAAE